MLRIYIDATKGSETLERILKSIQRQRVDIIKTTVVVTEEIQLEELKKKYEFDAIVTEKNVVKTIMQLIRQNDTEYFMIASANQILGVNLAEVVEKLSKEHDGIIFNISKIRTTTKFCEIYNKMCSTVYDAMKVRPVIQSGVFKTDIVNTNNVTLKSFSLGAQMNFIKRYFEYCKNPYYEKEVLSYIDYLLVTTKPSLSYVFKGDAYVKGVIKASANDMLYMTLKKPEVREIRRKIRKKIRERKH